MGAPDRTAGLPYHLGYGVIAFILLAIASFASADAVYAVATRTDTIQVRYAARDFCGYNMSAEAIVLHKIGCVYRDWGWSIPVDWFGFVIPTDIAQNYSKVAILSVASWAMVFVTVLEHAYSIRYSYRVTPPPQKDKLFSLVQLHFIAVGVCLLFTSIAFVAQVSVVGTAVGQSRQGAIVVTWGASVWLVLAAAIVQIGWAYEAVRWRAALLA